MRKGRRAGEDGNGVALDPPETRAKRAAMVERQLRRRGISDPRVLEVMARVPREAFLPPSLHPEAYEDRAVPIGQDQTLSQPYMVAAMTEALQVGPEDRILEIGTGSGYQAAVLALLAREVRSIERIASLAEAARRALDTLGIENVEIRVGDGSRGWPEEAPFDGIIVTAAAPDVPRSLLRQIASDGGRLLIPVGTLVSQDLIRVTRQGEDFDSETLVGCRFVPLLGEEGW